MELFYEVVNEVGEVIFLANGPYRKAYNVMHNYAKKHQVKLKLRHRTDAEVITPIYTAPQRDAPVATLLACPDVPWVPDTLVGAHTIWMRRIDQVVSFCVLLQGQEPSAKTRIYSSYGQAFFAYEVAVRDIEAKRGQL